MKTMKSEQGDFGGKHDMEINPSHSIITGLNTLRSNDDGLAKKIATQIFENAKAAAGLVEDPRTMVESLNNLVEVVIEAKK